MPCARVNYEPALSYAQLSKIKIERLVLKDKTKKKQVKIQYQMATEMFQRMDTDTWQCDTETIKIVIREMKLLTAAVNAGIANLTAGTVENWILELEQVVERDYNYMDIVVSKEMHDDMEGIWSLFLYSWSLDGIFSYLFELQANIANLEDVNSYLGDCVMLDLNMNYGYGE